MNQTTSSFLAGIISLAGLLVPHSASAIECYISNRSFSVSPGASRSLQVTCDRYGNASPIRITSNAPSGISVTANSNPITQNQASLTVTTSRIVSLGTKRFQVTFTAGRYRSIQPMEIYVTRSSAAPIVTVGSGGSSVPRASSGGSSGSGSTGLTTGTGGSSGTVGAGIITSSPPPSTTPTSAPSTPIASPTGLKAFPDAMGFGAYATGGRDPHSTVCIVKNLSGDPNTPHSFEWCTLQPGPKYITFEVSGVVASSDGTRMHGTDNTTILGQTSPGGIYFQGLYTDESAYPGDGFPDQDYTKLRRSNPTSNLIIRNIHSRPVGNGADDAFRTRMSSNVIIDSSSFENAHDESWEISYSHAITGQYLLMAESLGGHQYNGNLQNYSMLPLDLETVGDLARTTALLDDREYSDPNHMNGVLDNISLIRNDFHRLMGRYPELSRESIDGPLYIMDIEVLNNLYWDQAWTMDVAGENPFTGQPLSYRLNYIGNYAVARSTYRLGMIDTHLWDGQSRPHNKIYMSGNYMQNQPTLTDWQLDYCCNDFSAQTHGPNTSPAYGTSTPNIYSGWHADAPLLESRTQLRRDIYKNAGAFPRDPMDRRLMSNLCSGTLDPSAPNTDYRDAFTFDWTRAPLAPADTDQDGMPDTWEITHGLNPNVDDHNALSLSLEGYPAIEVYANELMAHLKANEPTTQDIGNCTF